MAMAFNHNCSDDLSFDIYVYTWIEISTVIIILSQCPNYKMY